LKLSKLDCLKLETGTSNFLNLTKFDHQQVHK
jgi:hypothetical protein